MSTIREKGKAYLKKKLGQDFLEPIAVSKFYKSEESWTKKPAWWFDLPIKKIKSNKKRCLLFAR